MKGHNALVEAKAPVQTLHTALGPIDVELPSDISEDVTGSFEFLQRAAQSLRFANSMSVYFRVMLGRQLLVVQEHSLWLQWGATIGIGKVKVPVETFKTWSQFLEHAFDPLFGLSRETAYGAIQLAKCKAIAALPAAELQRFQTLSNAIELARLERQGPVPENIVEAAMAQSMDEFHETIGRELHCKVTLRIVLQDPTVSGPLGRIVNFIKLADADALETLWATIERAKLRANDNPSDTLDCIIACCSEQWMQEGEPGSGSS